MEDYLKSNSAEQKVSTKLGFPLEVGVGISIYRNEPKLCFDLIKIRARLTLPTKLPPLRWGSP